MRELNLNVIRRWVAALRSGKYGQAEGSLRKDDGYCCLGVLTDLYIKKKGLEWDVVQEESYKSYTFLGCDSYPPPDVLDWAGMWSERSVTRYGKYLDDLNDEDELTFSEIANVIEKEAGLVE